MSKSHLGRGLGSLLGGKSASPAAAKSSPPAPNAPAAPAAPDSRERVERVALSRVRPCPLQPRKDFDEESLRELASSIKEQGIVQPLIVRARGEHLELIAGERRWRASQLAGLTEVPVLIREADDREVLELALIENLQRENLNAIEEALGYSQLMSLFSLTQEDVAVKVGKSRAAVANALRLLRLSADIQDFVRSGRLSVGHAKVILSIENPAQQRVLSERAIKEGLSVRQVEKIVARLQEPPAERTVVLPAAPNPHIADIENRLRERFGTKIHLRYHEGKGAVEIQFFDDRDLERILEMSGIKLD
jgi:ParB family chromosome partitioning protein